MEQTLYSNLPPLETLETDEINLGSPIMRASAIYLGKHCDELSKVSDCFYLFSNANC